MTMFFGWKRGAYRRADFMADALAGILIALMLIPQGMAYGQLGGVPPVVGLYASILPVVVYGLLGSTGILTLGPTAITSILVLNSLSPLAPPESPQYVVYAVSQALVLGIALIVTGFLRLGFVTNLLNQPVMIGYINAAALLIMASQVGTLLGLNLPSSPQFLVTLANLIADIPQVNPVTVVISVISVLAILALRYIIAPALYKWGLPHPIALLLGRGGSILVVIAMTIVVSAFHLDAQAGVAVIGVVPQGLPVLSFDGFDFTPLPNLISGALIISFVGLTEAIATARPLIGRDRKIAPNRELLAMGAANVASAVSGGLSVTTSVSRSAVNAAGGARSGLSSLVAAALVGLTVAFLTPLVYAMPKAVLAAIIFVSVLTLFDFKTIGQLWRYSRTDAIPLVVTFVGVLFTRIEVGIAAGIASAILLYFLRSARPKVTELGREDYSTLYVELTRSKSAARISQVLIVSIEESVYFANIDYLETRLRNMVADRPEVNNLIIGGGGMNFIDGSALFTLNRFIEDMERIGIKVYLAGLNDRMQMKLAASDIADTVNHHRMFRTIHEAVEATGMLPDPHLPI